MPKTRGEDDKKHGDKLESLIERTGGNPSGKRTESADEDEQDLRADEDDAALLQDDEDEDFDDEDDDDDIETDRDVGERD